MKIDDVLIDLLLTDATLDHDLTEFSAVLSHNGTIFNLKEPIVFENGETLLGFYVRPTIMRT